MPENNSLEELSKLLWDVDRLIVLSHFDPDPDAYGSMCALGMALSNAGKEVLLLNQNITDEQNSFIPGIENVQSNIPDNFNADLVVVCDCGDRQRIGDDLLKLIDPLKAPILNIDHHISNDYFGNYNLVLNTASSTSEIVFDLIKAMGISLNRDIAFALLTGIVADTGSFRYSLTSAKTFQVANELLSAGASTHEVSQAIYGNMPLSAVLLQADALSKLELYADDRVALVVVTEDMYAKFKAQPADTEHLVEKLRDIQGVEVAAVCKASEGIWRVSLRSKSDELNVSDVAKAFGGGGHRAAAAFRWRKEYKTLKELLVKRLCELFAAD